MAEQLVDADVDVDRDGVEEMLLVEGPVGVSQVVHLVVEVDGADRVAQDDVLEALLADVVVVGDAVCTEQRPLVTQTEMPPARVAAASGAGWSASAACLVLSNSAVSPLGRPTIRKLLAAIVRTQKAGRKWGAGGTLRGCRLLCL